MFCARLCIYKVCLEKNEQACKNREKKFQPLIGQRVWAGGRICTIFQYFPTIQVSFPTFVAISEVSGRF